MSCQRPPRSILGQPPTTVHRINLPAFKPLSIIVYYTMQVAKDGVLLLFASIYKYFCLRWVYILNSPNTRALNHLVSALSLRSLSVTVKICWSMPTGCVGSIFITYNGVYALFRHYLKRLKLPFLLCTSWWMWCDSVYRCMWPAARFKLLMQIFVSCPKCLSKKEFCDYI